MALMDKDLLSIAEARVLTETAATRATGLRSYSQAALNRAVDALFTLWREAGPALIEQNVAACGIGSAAAEQQLLRDFAERYQAALATQTLVGPLNADQPLRAVGVPVGTIAVLMSAFDPVNQAFFAAITALKAGNPLVLVPHPKLAAPVAEVVAKLDACAQQAGLPQGCVTVMQTVTPEGIDALLQNPAVAAVLDGRRQKNAAALRAAMPVYRLDGGASPVFVEQSADVQEAAAAIVASRSLDHGLLPAAEQFVIAEAVIATPLQAALKAHGAYFLSDADEAKLASLLRRLEPDSLLLCGQTAQTVAQRAGFSVPEDATILVSTQDYINHDSPYTDALAFPFVVFYLEPDWLRACAKCFTLLQESPGHTLAIHAQNPPVIQEFILKKPVARVVLNAPCGQAAIGLQSDLPASLWLGARSQLSAATFTAQRRVGYPATATAAAAPAVTQDQFMQLLNQLLKQSN